MINKSFPSIRTVLYIKLNYHRIGVEIQFHIEKRKKMYFELSLSHEWKQPREGGVCTPGQRTARAARARSPCAESGAAPAAGT